MESLRWLLPIGDPCGTLIIRSINDLVMTRRVFSITSTSISKLRYPRKTMPMSSFFIGAITSRVGSSHFLSRISLPKWVHVSGEGVSKVNCCMINRGSEPSPFFHRTCLRIEFEVEPVIKAQFFFDRKRISSCQCPSHNGIRSSRKLSLVTVKSCLGLFCPGILSLVS